MCHISGHVQSLQLFIKLWIQLVMWIQCVNSMSLINKHSYFMDNGASDSDVAEFVVSKGHLPNENVLPKASLVKNVDNDVTYLLSKLSDEELIKLLNDQPKKNVYDLNDIVKVAVGSKSVQDNNLVRDDLKTLESQNSNRFRSISNKDQSHAAFFKLDDKPVDPYSVKNNMDPNYAALQKINNLLYSRPSEDNDDIGDEDDAKKEMLFDVLVGQLKTLCCKRSKTSTRSKKNFPYKSLLGDLFPQSPASQMTNTNPAEFMFLVMNDEIKSNGSDDLISVDPDSLEKNSSVLLLGPITTPLSDTQLKSVMIRISSELSKPEYLPLLQQLSEGTLSGNKVRLMKSLITGPETRRYIKPHRCNHQSPLARVYGGPKWLICTGYLNLNTPSLYD